MENSTLILILVPFCFSLFLKVSPKRSPIIAILKTIVLVASPLILGYDAAASSNAYIAK